MEVSDHCRCERKFLISDLSTQEIEEIILLHPALFSPVHHQRFVNNIYFDDLEFLSFYENQNGTTPRKKVRIRWYGNIADQIKEPILEVKKKSGIVGTKEYHSYPGFALENFFSRTQTLNPANKSITDKGFVRELVLLEPTLINRYCRKYFLSADGNFRITLDSNINFFPVRPFLPVFFANDSFEPYCVLELKYGHAKDDKASEITKHFPFRLTKSSKYVSGILKLYSSFE
jgi:SPX domain protein involved in polyphosphate accumulation